MTDDDLYTETEYLASNDHGHHKDEDMLNTSWVEEDSSLLTAKKEKYVNEEPKVQPQNHNNSHSEDEVEHGSKTNDLQLRVQKNLYPNVLVSASRDHSDIDSDEEDFQMRQAASHRRNDSGQGSSITESNMAGCQGDFKRPYLTDEESIVADSSENSIENVMPEARQRLDHCGTAGLETPAKEFSSINLDENVAEILNKIQEGSDEVLSKARSSTLLASTNVTDGSLNSTFDEQSFIDIPLDSPGMKQNLNTYAPRPGLPGGSASTDLSDDLKKPSVTDTKSKPGFR